MPDKRVDLARLRSLEEVPDLVRYLADRGLPSAGFEVSADGVVLVQKRFQAVKAVGAPEAPSRESAAAMARKLGVDLTDALFARLQPYWASDERVDEHGQITLQDWIFDDFARNPVLANAHDWGGLPIGLVLDYEVRTRIEEDYEGRALYALAMFAEGETYPLAEQIFRLVQSRFLRGVSVGFISERPMVVLDPEERATIGLPDHGMILTSNRLIEISPVMLGANVGALAIAASLKVARGLGAGRGEVDAFREVLRRQAPDDSWDRLEETLLACASVAFPDEDFGPRHDRAQAIEVVAWQPASAPKPAVRKFSLAKALRALAKGGTREDFEAIDAGFEFEVLNEAAEESTGGHPEILATIDEPVTASLDQVLAELRELRVLLTDLTTNQAERLGTIESRVEEIALGLAAGDGEPAEAPTPSLLEFVRNGLTDLYGGGEGNGTARGGGGG